MLFKTLLNYYDNLNQQSISNEHSMKEYTQKQLQWLNDFIANTPRENYDWYINDTNNFVTFYINNDIVSHITINGITKEQLIIIFKNNNTELGENLYDKQVKMLDYRLKRYYD